MEEGQKISASNITSAIHNNESGYVSTNALWPPSHTYKQTKTCGNRIGLKYPFTLSHSPVTLYSRVGFNSPSKRTLQTATELQKEKFAHPATVTHNTPKRSCHQNPSVTHKPASNVKTNHPKTGCPAHYARKGQSRVTTCSDTDSPSSGRPESTCPCRPEASTTPPGPAPAQRGQANTQRSSISVAATCDGHK
jgi:hypothetical protein